MPDLSSLADDDRRPTGETAFDTRGVTAETAFDTRDDAIPAPQRQHLRELDLPQPRREQADRATPPGFDPELIDLAFTTYRVEYGRPDRPDLPGIPDFFGEDALTFTYELELTVRNTGYTPWLNAALTNVTLGSKWAAPPTGDITTTTLFSGESALIGPVVGGRLLPDGSGFDTATATVRGSEQRDSLEWKTAVAWSCFFPELLAVVDADVVDGPFGQATFQRGYYDHAPDCASRR